MLSSASDDEVRGDQARSAPAMFAPPICRRSRRNVSRTKLVLPRQSFRWIRRRRRLPSETSQRAERAIKHSEHSERSNQIVQLWIAL